MPTPAITTTYAGEVLDQFKLKLVENAPTLRGGYMMIHDQIRDKVTIPRLQADAVFQDRAATPTSAGSVTVDEVSITPRDFMLYLEFNPRNFESFWRPFQPVGPLVFRELPANVQSAMLEALIRQIEYKLERMIWRGNTSLTTYLKYFNGLVALASADSGVLDVASPTTLSKTNIVAELGKLRDTTPSELWDHPEFKIFINTKTRDFYIEAQHDATYKGVDFTQGGLQTYWGKPLSVVPGLPDNTMYATVSSAGMDSNIHMALDWDNSVYEPLQVEKLQANSELYFIKGLMKAAVNHVWGDHVVLYTS